MKYIRRINEDTQESQIIKDLKSLPYNQFITTLIDKSKSGDFQNQLSKITSKSTESTDYGIVKNKYISAEYLIPTQSQIGLKESLSWLKNVESVREIIVDKKANLFDNNRILIANNKWIIDGHHRWSYVYMLNPKAEIPCININLPDTKPEDILKNIQISLAATYKDLYVRSTPIQLNISQLSDEKIYSSIEGSISSDNMGLLRQSYAETDLMKIILKDFIIPESLYEANLPTQNDFLVDEPQMDSTDIDPEFQKLDEEDNDNPDKSNIMDTATDFAGILDPTGVIDILKSIDCIYRGDYLMGIFYLVAAVPLGDIIAKPMIALAKSAAYRKSLKVFAELMKKFDAKKAAEVWLKLEKMSPLFQKFAEFMLTAVNKINQLLEKVLRAVGDHWLKFKIFYWIFKNRIYNFFSDMINWKKNLKDYLTKVSEEEVVGIIATNLVNIKRLIIDKKVDKMNVNFSIGPHPVQTALKARRNPYTGDFKGVPKDFLSNIPSLMSGLKNFNFTKPVEQKLGDFKEFTKKQEPKVETPKVEVPKEITKQPLETKPKEVVQNVIKPISAQVKNEPIKRGLK